MGSIKYRNGMDITEAEDIKKRWQGYIELYKKDLDDPDNHKGVIIPTHLEPDILECEVRWALGCITTNKTTGGDGIPVELCIISYMKRGASPGSMYYTGCLGLVNWDDPEGWNGEEGGGFRMGNTCIPVADSFWYLAKLIQLCKF